MSSQVKDEILKLVDVLPESQLEKLLDVIKKMQDKSMTKGKFDRFCGLLTAEEADSMKKVIEEEFERVEDDA